MLKKPMNNFPFTETVCGDRLVIKAFVNIEWRGVPVTWSADLSVERRVQR